MDLINDLRVELINKIESMGIKYDKDDDTYHILLNYLNVINRMIYKVPRIVFISDEINKKIEDKIIPSKYIEALKLFYDKFRSGDDMNPYLSRRIYKSKLSKSKMSYKGKESRDLLLYDWGIHHLHLTTEEVKVGKKTSTRSEYLLFVKVKPNAIYFIDVLKHDTREFANKNLIRIIDRNWPKLLEDKILSDIEIYDEFNEKDIIKFRQMGNLVPYNIDGKTYILIGGGITSNSINNTYVTIADDIFNTLNKIEEYINESKAELLKSVVSSEEFNHVNNLDYELTLIGNTFAIRNKLTKEMEYIHYQSMLVY